MTVERQLLTSDEVAAMLGIGKTSAYTIIKRLNKELEEKGYITVTGKISRAYFQERCYGVQMGGLK